MFLVKIVLFCILPIFTAFWAGKHTAASYYYHQGLSAEHTFNRLSTLNPRLQYSELQNIRQNWNEALFAGDFFPEIYIKFARSLLPSLVGNLSWERKAQLLCYSARLLDKAIAQRPSDASFRVAFADLQFQLGDLINNCGGSINSAKVSARAHIDKSLELAPYGTVEPFSAAVTLLGAGERKKSFEILRQLENVNPLYTAEQRQFVVQSLRDQEELDIALPTRFPGVLLWAQLYERHYPTLAQLWRASFEKNLLIGLKRLTELVENDSSIMRQFRITLIQTEALQLTNLSPKLIKAIREIQSKFSLNNTEKELYSLLSTYVRTYPPLGTASNDRNPKLGSLSSWSAKNRFEELNFSTRLTSLGYYLSEKSDISKILLHSWNANSGLKAKDIEVWISKDNRFYHRIDTNERNPMVSISEYSLTDRLVFLLSLNVDLSKHYLKLHHSQPSKEIPFSGPSYSLIQALREPSS